MPRWLMRRRTDHAPSVMKADDSGATMVEYALMIGLIALVAFVAVGAVGIAASDLFTKFPASL